MSKRRRHNKPQQSNQDSNQSAPKSQSPQPQALASRESARKSVQTISQQRAKHALDQIQSKMKDHGSLQSYITAMPAMILMSGFGQTCAFYYSKGNAESGKDYLEAYNGLSDWLINEREVFSGSDLLKGIVESSSDTYQLAQAEALAYLDWLKKFAKAYLKEAEDAGTE